MNLISCGYKIWSDRQLFSTMDIIMEAMSSHIYSLVILPWPYLLCVAIASVQELGLVKSFVWGLWEAVYFRYIQ